MMPKIKEGNELGRENRGQRGGGLFLWNSGADRVLELEEIDMAETQ